MYINKVGKINTFKIKTGYYLEILTPATMKVLGNLEALKVIQLRKKIGENVPSLEITQVVLVRCNTVNNVYQHDPRDLLHFFLINPWLNYQIFHQKNIFLKTLEPEFSCIDAWFTDQNSKTVEDKIR